MKATPLQLALSNTPAGYFTLAALILIALKLSAAAIQIWIQRNDFRRAHTSTLFRVAYVTGKSAPALAAACACAAAILAGKRTESYLYGGLAIASALLAVYVVHLRKQGRFYGALDAFLRRPEA